jgi:hypothetical protein
MFTRQIHLLSINSLDDSNKVPLCILHIFLFFFIYKCLFKRLLTVFPPWERAYPLSFLRMHLGTVGICKHPLLLHLPHVLISDILSEVLDLLLHLSRVLLNLMHFKLSLRFLMVKLGVKRLSMDLFSILSILFEGDLLSFVLLCSSMLSNDIPYGKTSRQH